MFIYFFLVRIASLWNEKAKKLVRGNKTALKLLAERVTDGRWVWFHAASVGEFEQGRPIIEKLKSEHPELCILLTFFSPSGYEMHKNYSGADIVSYLPFATIRNAKRFLDIVKPEKAFFIKYEFWPAYLKQLRKRRIPAYSVASVFRKEQAFFRPLIGNVYRSLLRCFTLLFVQDENSKLLLENHGITNVSVTGDPRFNRVMQIASNAMEMPLAEHFTEGMAENRTGGLHKKDKILVAGSTWPADEELLAQYIETHHDVRLILVPHEIDANHLKTIFRIFEGRYIRYSEATLKNIDLERILVVDRLGMLSSLYRYADVAYIGGGFGVGIHNTLEAAVYGVPVVWGKNYHRFREAQGLIAAGAGIAVDNYQTLETALDTAFKQQIQMGQCARNYILAEADAADKIYSQIF